LHAGNLWHPRHIRVAKALAHGRLSAIWRGKLAGRLPVGVDSSPPALRGAVLPGRPAAEPAVADTGAGRLSRGGDRGAFHGPASPYRPTHAEFFARADRPGSRHGRQGFHRMAVEHVATGFARGAEPSAVGKRLFV